jgi:hypothetical protein
VATLAASVALYLSLFMLTHHRKPICLSFMAFDLPLWSVVETAATLYDRGEQRFHLLLTEPTVQGFEGRQVSSEAPLELLPIVPTPRLLWLELSPYRVVMTMQGDGNFSYRHAWEPGVYGLSRYWLQHSQSANGEQLRLRNFTRSLTLTGKPLPHHLRLEYELWSDTLRLGHYVLNLEIHH